MSVTHPTRMGTLATAVGHPGEGPTASRTRPTRIAIARFQRVVSVTRVKQKAAMRRSVTADCELVCSILSMGLRR
jgi:hypothetical protein